MTDHTTPIAAAYRTAREVVGRYFVGKEALVELIFISLLSGGHILLEGVPGTAKTTLARTIARLSGCTFHRVQCTVDTQPADILGVRIYDQDRHEFEVRKGPIFANVLLIDELNRLNPRTQSAFIEAMSERQVTIEGETLALPDPFFVIGTQNPHEFEGTFPLLEAQKDRFICSMTSIHLDRDQELEVIRREQAGTLDWEGYAAGIRPTFACREIPGFHTAAQQIAVEEPVLTYIRDLVMATREHGDVNLGASTRASLAMVRCGRARAALHERSYVLPDDVKAIAHPVLDHRLVLRRESELGGITPARVVDEILGTVEVP